MSATDKTPVPVWTIGTAETSLPALDHDVALTPQRLSELRSALAAFAAAPLVTLEAHPLPANRDRSPGLALDSMSPLAQELSRLVSSHATKVPAVANVAESSEVLYRMVVPSKVAAQVGKGLVKPMPSKAAANGVYGDLVGGTRNLVAAKATFVPVEAASAGAAGTAVGTAAGTAAAGTAMTVAAPLVLMAVAVGASAYADQQRQKAIENITVLLERLHDANLENERSQLDGCRGAIDKATALLLDRGRVGASLGLDSAVHAIDTAHENALRRVHKWEKALDTIDDDRVDLADLETAFPGIGEEGGAFRTHIELAALTVALKRRVIVLQGVEAAQGDPDNPFDHFARSLKADQERVDDLETRIEQTLSRLSSLELRPPKRLIDKVMTRKQVDNLLDSSYRLRSLSTGLRSADNTDVVIEIEKHADGTVTVLPAHSA